MERIIRVLLVDDYEPWHRCASTMLGKQPRLKVISTVSDGIEAVAQAEELQPHLILLDIGLPKLNGIEAARRIRECSPNSKILFVSQESSPDIVRQCLQLGDGYVLKAHAASELLKAVEVVLYGRQFVSSPLVSAYRESSDENVKSRDGFFRVDMDFPMPVNLPEEEQIERILRGSYVADCNDVQARMYGLDSPKDLIGRRMAEMVVPDDSKNIELTRQFIRSGYQVRHRKSFEVDVQGNAKVFLNSMTGIIVEGKLIATMGRQSDITRESTALPAASLPRSS